MIDESIVPEHLREAFKEFSILNSEEEKDEFWKELAKKNSDLSPEFLSQQLKEGVVAISERVKFIQQKVKEKVSA